MNITPAELAEIEELNRNRTQGDWEFVDAEGNQFVMAGDEYICALAGVFARDNDFKFIARAAVITPKLVQAVRELQWRPIETAPKEGRILLMRGGRSIIGYWDTQKYHSNPKPYWASDTSCVSVTRDRSTPPTHWMPLPQPTPNGKE